MDWSPEQVSVVYTRLDYPISHEWIYSYVLTNFYGGDGVFTHPRNQLLMP